MEIGNQIDITLIDICIRFFYRTIIVVHEFTSFTTKRIVTRYLRFVNCCTLIKVFNYLSYLIPTQGCIGTTVIGRKHNNMCNKQDTFNKKQL